MKLNLAKALGLGVVLYVILFLIATIVMYVLGIPYLGQVMIFATPLFSIPLAYIYLMEVPEKQLLFSLELGFLWAILTAFLDIPVYVYMFNVGWGYFNAATVWAVYGEIIFFNLIIGGLVEGTK